MSNTDSNSQSRSKASHQTEQRPAGGMGFRGGAGRRGMPVEKPKNPLKTLRRLRAYLAAEKRFILLVFALVVLASVAALAAPYLIGKAIDDYIIPGDFSGLLYLVIGMGALYILGATSTWLQQYTMIGIGQRVVYNMRRDLFAKLQTLPLRFFDRQTHGEIMSRLTNDIDNISHGLNNSISQVFSSTITVVGTFAMMVWLSPLMTLLTVLTMPLIIFCTSKIASYTRRYYKEQQINLGNLNGLVEETIGGQRVVKVFAREDEILADFSKANQNLRQSGFRAQVFSGIIWPLMNILNNLTFIIVAVAGGYLAIQGLVTVGIIAAFINYSKQFTRPLNELANQFNMLQSAVAGAERFLEIMDEPAEPADAPDATTLQVGQVEGAVKISNLSFGYNEDDPVLKDINLDVQPGQTIALVGPTGAGKTTIINLLTRFYDIIQGKITIDGQDIRSIQRHCVRSLLGIVLQDTYLFSGTIRDNIAYGRLDATNEEIEQAAKLANADSFIRRLPKGYNTFLGEDGGDLSQGQRQLLAIARAILADPAILILDEATSSVDTLTEVQIQQAMLELMRGRTSFVIAHRLSTIRHADLIVVINQGRIEEQGTHEELLRQQGFYYHLYTNQFQRKAI